MTQRECLRMIEECATLVEPDASEFQQWTRDFAHSSRYRLAEDLKLIWERAKPRARVLGFGASPPFLGLARQHMGYDYHGLDISPERYARVLARQRIDIRKVNFETEPVPFEDQTFDITIFNAVCEHLRIDLIATLTEVRRVMKVGGTLFLLTPNFRSLRGFWMLARHHSGTTVGGNLYDQYNYMRLYGFMGHVREYAAREVSVFLPRIGLTTERIIFRYYGPPLNNPLPLALCALLERTVCAVFPSLRPLFSLVCVRTPDR
ncbi:MAG: class I SAM-dependent methyltransferase [Planctomycetota bacterium]